MQPNAWTFIFIVQKTNGKEEKCVRDRNNCVMLLMLPRQTLPSTGNKQQSGCSLPVYLLTFLK